jgi:sortase A
MFRKVFVGSLIFLFGLFLYFYPWIADTWNSYRNLQLIQSYQTGVDHKDFRFENEAMRMRAMTYNRKLVLHTQQMVTIRSYETENAYDVLLNMGFNGLMASVEIPRLQLKLPVYHYSNDDSLSVGIGHIHGSTLPVGGDFTNSVLTGHCGLPNQKLFTDLEKLGIGDVFYIHVLGRILAYEVDDISIVLPDDVENILAEPGCDWVTLVTCTPYGVNTHRLLVRGRRVDYNAIDVDAVDAEGKLAVVKDKVTFLNMLVVLLVGYFIWLLAWFISYVRKVRRQGGRRK